MKYRLALIALIICCQGFGQCPFSVTLKSKGGLCSGSDTLVVSTNNTLSKIEWYNGNTVDTTVTAVANDLSIGETVAGGNGPGAAANQLFDPLSVFVDGSGNIYVADLVNSRIQKFPPGSTSSTNGITVAGGNGVGATANKLSSPYNAFVDTGGNIYVTDFGNNRIQKFPPGSTSGTLGITVAGGNGRGSNANQLADPQFVSVDGSGNIYVVDGTNSRIQKFPPGSTGATNGITVAGGNGWGQNANQFLGPASIYIDGGGNMYVADQLNNRVQKFPPGSTGATNGITVAGGNGPGTAGNQLDNPRSVYVDGSGNIYVADVNNNRIQKFPPGSTSATNGITIAGGNGRGAAANQFYFPYSVYVDKNGSIYVADDDNNRVQKFSTISYTIDTVFIIATPGTYKAAVTDNTGCTVTTGSIVINPVVTPSITISDSAAHFLPCTSQVADTVYFTAHAINGGTAPVYQWKVNGITAGTNSPLFKGTFNDHDTVYCMLTGNALCSATTTATSNNYILTFNTTLVASLINKGGICAGADTLVVRSANTNLSKIVWYNGNTVDTTVTAAGDTAVSKQGVTVAGGNGYGSAANQFSSPEGFCFDGAGNMYVADAYNHRIQKFPPNSTGATNGVTVAGGNGYGSALNQFAPASVSIDGGGNIYVADWGNSRILKFPPGSTSTTNGIVVAGGFGTGSALNELDNPITVYVDGAGNIYVNDNWNNRIIEFPPGSPSTTNGKIVAGGNGSGQANNQFDGVASMCVDADGDVYVADGSNNRVLKFPAGSNSGTEGTVVAGGNGYGPAANQLSFPYSVFVDGNGYLFVADIDNDRIERFPPGSTSATNGTTVAGGNGLGAAANQFNYPYFVVVDNSGDIFVADDQNNRIQEFRRGAPIDTLLIPLVPGTYTAQVTDSSGCTVTTNAIVVNPSAIPSVSISANKVAACAGIPVTFTASVSNAGATPFYQWLVNGMAAGTNNPAYTNTALTNGDSVNCIVSDIKNCISADTSNSILPIIWPLPVVGPDTSVTIQLGQSTTLNMPVAGDIAHYLWMPPVWLSGNTIANPVATPFKTTTYSLEVVSTDGCGASGSVTVKVASKIMIPSAFTPNGDGHNDVFYVLGGEPGDKIKDFSIFNRWGQRIFEVRDAVPGDASFGWNGNYNGAKQPTGTYIYIVTMALGDGATKVYQGSVVIIR